MYLFLQSVFTVKFICLKLYMILEKHPPSIHISIADRIILKKWKMLADTRYLIFMKSIVQAISLLIVYLFC